VTATPTQPESANAVSERLAKAKRRLMIEGTEYGAVFDMAKLPTIGSRFEAKV
jgi:hypothetical protein